MRIESWGAAGIRKEIKLRADSGTFKYYSSITPGYTILVGGEKSAIRERLVLCIKWNSYIP